MAPGLPPFTDPVLFSVDERLNQRIRIDMIQKISSKRKRVTIIEHDLVTGPYPADKHVIKVVQ